MRRLCVSVGGASLVLAAVLWGAAVMAAPIPRMLSAKTVKAAMIEPLASTVPTSRWLVRCSVVPVSAASGISVTATANSRPRVKEWRLKKGDNRGRLACYLLGRFPAVTGDQVASCDGPTIMASRMADATECDIVRTYPQVATLPAPALAWLQSKLTCCGEATAGGRTLSAWRCSRAGITMVRLDGYGPGVTAGTDPCEAYQ